MRGWLPFKELSEMTAPREVAPDSTVPSRLDDVSSQPADRDTSPNSTLLVERIRRARPSFSAMETAVADHLLSDPSAVVSATTAELAKAAGVSQASVVRFARSLGYEGLPALRLSLARELTRLDVEHELSGVARGRIDASDSLHDLAHKIGFHEARSIEDTVSGLDLTCLDEVAHAIAARRPVTVLGVGASGLVAEDLCQKLQRIGQQCQFTSDTHLQLVQAAMRTPQDVVIGISFSGRTVETHKALALAANAGALSVAITGNPDSPIGQVVSHVLTTTAREDELRIGALASRMAQLAVVDVLFARIAQLRFDDLDAALGVLPRDVVNAG